MYIHIQVFYKWRKVAHEFFNRMDPDLFYHTSTHKQFYEGLMLAFDTKPNKKPRENVFPDMSYWEPMIESLWLFMVPVQ